jgi:hypothetical protein
MWTEVAFAAAALAASRICVGDFAATPFPEEDEPHPARRAARASRDRTAARRGRLGKRIGQL